MEMAVFFQLPVGITKEQLAAIFDAARILSEQKDLVYRNYMQLLKAEGVELLSFADMQPDDKVFLEHYFKIGRAHV